MSEAKQKMITRLEEGHVVTEKKGELRTLKSLVKEGKAVQIWDTRYALKNEKNRY